MDRICHHSRYLSTIKLMLVQKLSRRDRVMDRLCVRKHQRCCAIWLIQNISTTESILDFCNGSYDWNFVQTKLTKVWVTWSSIGTSSLRVHNCASWIGSWGTWLLLGRPGGLWWLPWKPWIALPGLPFAFPGTRSGLRVSASSCFAWTCSQQTTLLTKKETKELLEKLKSQLQKNIQHKS